VSHRGKLLQQSQLFLLPGKDLANTDVAPCQKKNMGMSSNTSSSNIQQATKHGNSGNPMKSPSNMEIGKIYGNKCDLNIIRSIQQATKLGNEDIGWILIVRYKYVYDSVSEQSTDVPKPPHHPMFFW